MEIEGAILIFKRELRLGTKIRYIKIPFLISGCWRQTPGLAQFEMAILLKLVRSLAFGGS